MHDSIDRQAAIEAIGKILPTNPIKNEYTKGYIVGVALALKYVMQLPSAQPEVIRCKECKHYKFADNRAFGFPVKRCEWTGFEDVDNDDFCSRAER